MTALLAAVLTASLMGSLHCVGMCGPMALWASGVSQGQSALRTALHTSAYHLGRLSTYLLAGLIAGLVGSAITASGYWLGIQAAAARLAGGVMIAMGLWQLALLARPHWRRTLPVPPRGEPVVSRSSWLAFWNLKSWGQNWADSISRMLASVRPHVVRLPRPLRSFATGLLTVLLPCGWLYLFVLVAAGSGGVVSAVWVMTAFWIGSVPALVGLVAGAMGAALRARPRFPRLFPLLGCALLLISGAYTATGRAATDLRALEVAATDVPTADQRLDKLADEPLPCCQHVP